MDTLDQLHVVSDLHLGGVPGHQIFNQGRALAAVIDYLGRQAAGGDLGRVEDPHHPGRAEGGGRIGLVLNGDIVDFLAAEDAMYLDPKGAIRKLRAVFEDQAFRPVWDALARFVSAEHAVLVLVLGNHDVELALPLVTEVLLARLCGENRAARKRVRLAMDGNGYTCTIAGRKVLCVHGNQVDPWNPIDFAALRRVGHAHAAGREPMAWEPNAGTRLVVDVMNRIKMDYAFVDLLKPETVPVPAVLLALPIEHQAPVVHFAKIMVRRLFDQGRLTAGFLGGKSVDDLSDTRAVDLLLRPGTWEQPAGRTTAAWTGIDWLRQATEDHAVGHRPVDLVDTGAGEALGFSGLVVDRLRGRDTRDNLREALATYLASDRSFRFDSEDEIFPKLDATAGDADCVIAGHTHLARRLLRRQAPGVYFNSGTWIRLMQLTPAMLTSEGFGEVYEALCAGTLEALDDIPDLVLQRRTMVSVWTEGDEVHGEIRSALPASPASLASEEGDPPKDPPWRSEAGTQFIFGRPGEVHRAARAEASW